MTLLSYSNTFYRCHLQHHHTILGVPKYKIGDVICFFHYNYLLPFILVFLCGLNSKATFLLFLLQQHGNALSYSLCGVFYLTFEQRWDKGSRGGVAMLEIELLCQYIVH